MKWGRACSVALGMGTLALHQYDTHYCYERFNRNVRTLFAAVRTVWDYKVTLTRHPEMLPEIHTKVAYRWYNICCRNSGLYIKLGQSVSMQNHVLPPEFAALFATLQDRAPTISFDEVCSVIKEEFGASHEEIFSEFDKEAVASASIAQVHRAVLKDGTPVAVKVQKPNIRYQMPWDLRCYRILVWCFEKTFSLPIYFTVDNVCESVSKEADFKCEAQFTERARRDLVGKVDNVYVPKVYHQLTEKRVMTMEWIDGVKLSHFDDIARMGFSLKTVMTTVFQAFAHQVFISGFVHGDPHPGNLLVRKKPGNQQNYEVVLLDHGLYVPERPQFREQYCRLWMAMVLTDFDELTNICHEWGIVDPELFASMQLFKPMLNKKKAIHVAKVSRLELVQLQLQTKERIRELLSDTSKLPLELIILARTMSILRGINKQAGSIVNRINIFALAAADGSIANRSTRLRSIHRITFKFRLWLIEAAYYTTNFIANVRDWLGLSAAHFEHILEQRMSDSLEQKLGFRFNFNSTDLG